MSTVVISLCVGLRKDECAAMKGWLEERAAELLQNVKVGFFV